MVQQWLRWGVGRVMVWEGISYNHRRELHVFIGSMNAMYYRDNISILHGVPHFRRHQDLHTSQHDNAPAHTYCSYQTMPVLIENVQHVLSRIAFLEVHMWLFYTLPSSLSYIRYIYVMQCDVCSSATMRTKALQSAVTPEFHIRDLEKAYHTNWRYGILI